SPRAFSSSTGGADGARPVAGEKSGVDGAGDAVRARCCASMYDERSLVGAGATDGAVTGGGGRAAWARLFSAHTPGGGGERGRAVTEGGACNVGADCGRCTCEGVGAGGGAAGSANCTASGRLVSACSISSSDGSRTWICGSHFPSISTCTSADSAIA